MHKQSPETPFGLTPMTRHLLGAMALFAMLGAVLFSVIGVEALPGFHGTAAGDFDIFYTVAQLALQDRLAEAYSVETLVAAQAELGREVHDMTWTYPPPFDLVLMPLGLASETAAYLIFTLSSLAALLWALKSLSGAYFGVVLFASLPAILVSVRTGQNGTLTAALIAIGCLLVLRHKDKWAGAAFGAMIVKPHLAVGVGLWCLLRWRPQIIATAVATAIGLSALSAVVLGFDIWGVFLASTAEAGDRLGDADYPAFRMGSLFAALVSFGIAPNVALAAHTTAAVLALCAVIYAARALDTKMGLTAAIMLTPLFSPYIYDYDLALFAPALAILLPTIDRTGLRQFALPIIALVWVTGGTGFAQNTRGAADGVVNGVTFAGFGAVVLALIVLALGTKLRSTAKNQKNEAGLSAQTTPA